MSFDEISKMFDEQSLKLAALFDAADSGDCTSIPEIIKTYYHVMNVMSLAEALKEGADSGVLDKIRDVKRLVSERFDSVIHPRIMKRMSLSVRELNDTLQSKSAEKPNGREASEAELFDTLRQSMSTKEFVEQYDKGISHD